MSGSFVVTTGFKIFSLEMFLRSSKILRLRRFLNLGFVFNPETNSEGLILQRSLLEGWSVPLLVSSSPIFSSSVYILLNTVTLTVHPIKIIWRQERKLCQICTLTPSFGRLNVYFSVCCWRDGSFRGDNRSVEVSLSRQKYSFQLTYWHVRASWRSSSRDDRLH